MFAYAADANDSEEQRSEKNAILLVSSCCSVAGLGWSAMYFVVFGPGLIAALPLLFVLVVGGAIIAGHLRRDHMIAAYAQVACIIYVTSVIQWSIGGLFDSGFVLAWAFCGPVTALMVFSIRQSAVWLLLYLVNVAITVIFDDVFSAHALPVDDQTRAAFVAMNLSCSAIVVFVFASFFVRSALAEREKANQLLLNILPRDAARRLKSGEKVIAERFEDVSVLFADIVAFTGYAATRQPERVVSQLNEIFSRFDALTEEVGLEKIKTIGDAYMVVGGLNQPDPDHPVRMARLALRMQAEIGAVRRDDGRRFSLRIGAHVGPAVAGVIGRRKIAYDLWGDTINVASRLESQGVDGAIQVSETFRARLGDRFSLTRRGEVALKGRGAVEAWLLLADRGEDGRARGAIDRALM